MKDDFNQVSKMAKMSNYLKDTQRAYVAEHSKCYGKEKLRFEWSTVTHPGVWACGGGRSDLPPVLVGITFQVPQEESECAWWCYLGPRPNFENEFDPEDKDKRYFDQC